jgi:protein-disulfide isomerase-like protein with CxxC motif
VTGVQTCALPIYAGSINDVAPFIKTAYKHVENYTGVKFGETFEKQLLHKKYVENMG